MDTTPWHVRAYHLWADRYCVKLLWRRALNRHGLTGVFLIVVGIWWTSVGIADLRSEDPPFITFLWSSQLSAAVWFAAGALAIWEGFSNGQHRWVWWVITLPAWGRVGSILLGLTPLFPGPPDWDDAVSPIGINLCRIATVILFAQVKDRPAPMGVTDRTRNGIT